MARVTLDLSTFASGLVVKNRPQASLYKSNVTRGAIHYLLTVKEFQTIEVLLLN